MSTSAEITALARAAGAAGRSWAQFTCDDEPQDYVCDHDDHDADIAAWQAAFDAGATEHRLAEGWVARWTTATVDYDGFGTTSELAGDWRGKQLRKVLIHPHYVGWHEARYSAGFGGCWSTDPHVEERELEEREARWRADDERHAAARAAGLRWLAALTDAELSEVEYDDVEAHGIDSADLRAARDDRAHARAEAERVETWDRCRAAVRDGMILVDDGEPSRSHRYGNIPGRDAHVYYDVRLANDWAKIADDACVIASSGEHAGSLALVAEWLASGRLRAVSADDVPPASVTKRIGHDRYREIRRVVIGDRVVWVGGQRFGSETLVLDERGHLVRSKTLRAAALSSSENPR